MTPGAGLREQRLAGPGYGESTTQRVTQRDPEGERMAESEEDPVPHIRALMRDGALIAAAMRAAGRDAARRHKAMGVPLVVCVHGEIRHIPPDEIEVDSTDALDVAVSTRNTDQPKQPDERPLAQSSDHFTSNDAAAAWLQAHMDELYERMQDPAIAEAARKHFDASPGEFGRAAVEAANRERRARTLSD